MKKTIFCAPVPKCTASFCNALTNALQRHGVVATVHTSTNYRPTVTVEHLQSPIELTADQTRLFIEITSKQDAMDVIEQTLLNEQFNADLAAAIPHNQLFTLEVLVTTFIAREVTRTYVQSQKTPARLKRCAQQQARMHSGWVERHLGTPDLREMLAHYAEELLATGFRR